MAGRLLAIFLQTSFVQGAYLAALTCGLLLGPTKNLLSQQERSEAIGVSQASSETKQTRTDGTDSPEATGAESQTELARSRLMEKERVDFDQVPIGNLADFLAKQLDLPVVLDKPAFADAGIPLDTPVTLHLPAAKLATALEILAHTHGIHYYFCDDVLVLTTPEAAEENTRTEVYPVHDIIERIRGLHSGTAFGIGGVGGTTTHDTNPTDAWTGSHGPPTRRLQVPFVLDSNQNYYLRSAAVQRHIHGLEQAPANIADRQLDIANLMDLPQAKCGDMSRGVQPGSAGNLGHGSIGCTTAVVNKQFADSHLLINQEMAAWCQYCQPMPGHADRDAAAQRLVEVITCSVESDSWDVYGGHGCISEIGGVLVISQTERVHYKIERLLEKIRRAMLEDDSNTTVRDKSRLLPK